MVVRLTIILESCVLLWHCTYACFLSYFMQMTVTWTSGYNINEAVPIVEWGRQGETQSRSPAATLTFDRTSLCGMNLFIYIMIASCCQFAISWFLIDFELCGAQNLINPDFFLSWKFYKCSMYACCIRIFPCYLAGSPARTVGWRDPGFIHTGFLKNLWPNSV